MSTNSAADRKVDRGSQPCLKILQPPDIAAIDQALKEIGLYGEVHLVIENGRLRFIRTLRSEALVRASTPPRRDRDR